MKKIFLLASIFALLSTLTIQAQVTIGSLTPPDSSAVLQVISPDSTKGVLIPEMSTGKRDLIKNPADGLVIYNTDESCFNYFNAPNNSWISICGGTGKATFGPITCSTDIAVFGIYSQGVQMNSGNYMTVLVNVDKPGNYTVTGKTNNGYGFTTSGVALNKGSLTIIVPAQGTPTKQGIDQIAMNVNGTDLQCDMAPTDSVGGATPTYTISCGGVQVNQMAVFTTTSPAESNLNNTVVVPIQVSAATPTTSAVSITSDTQNGVSFSGTGSVTAPGTYRIVIYPTGTFTSSDPVTFTLTTNSAGGSTTCQFTVTPVVPALVGGVVSWGTNPYAVTAPGGASSNQTGNMLANPANFGPKGIVPYAGNGIQVTNNGVTDNIATVLGNTTNPPDIAFISYAMTLTTTNANAIVAYIKRGGVVILTGTEVGTAPQLSIITSLYPGSSFNAGVGGSRTFRLPTGMTTDPIINGPFMDLSGRCVAEDAAGDQYVTPVPSTVINYANGSTGTGLGTPIANTSFFLRDNGTGLNGAPYNFIYIADGGFWNTYTQGVAFTGNDYPTTTTGGVNAVPSYRLMASSGQNIYNAYLLCNIMSWALNKAVTNGVNAANYK